VKTLSQRIGFIGAGNMGEAFVGAMLKTAIVTADRISVSDVNPDRLALLKEKYSIFTLTDNAELFRISDIIVLAVKPQQVVSVLSEITSRANYGIDRRKLFISIVAGMPIHKIENLLYSRLNDKDLNNLPIIRVMPNTPALALCGMSGMSSNKYCVGSDIEITETILTAMGKVMVFKEEDLDAVTAMSGSGPAYLFYFAEAMIEAGLALGLLENASSELTLQTLKGAIALMEKTGETPEELRRKVTSPGGTTQAALEIFEKRELKNTIMEGIFAAANRSRELSGA
jgi:pyrroline-5-carboxylate reductase